MPSIGALLEAAPDTSRLVACPRCHLSHGSLTQEALETGEGWRCIRCGQEWDARRLATVAAYAVWAAEHERVQRQRGSAAGQGEALSRWDGEGGGAPL